MPHKQKRWNPNRADKAMHQDMGYTAIPKGWRPVREPNFEEIDREMSERMRLDEYYREHQSA